MAKLTYDDKMRIQTLREQCMGAEAIKSAYPMKNWSIDTLKTTCQRIDATGSSVERRQWQIKVSRECQLDLAMLAFRKRLQACVPAEGDHFEHLLN